MDIVSSDKQDTGNQEQQTQEQTPDSLVGMSAEVDSQIDYLSALDEKLPKEVTITEEQKNAFLTCLVTGERYKETFNLFNGKLIAVIRCRSAEETDAIMTKMSRDAVLGSIKSDYEYSSEMRILMLVAQVERVNDTIYTEMKKPLLQMADGENIIPPGWLEDYSSWRQKPEVLLSALGTAVAEFEARYWKMVSEAKNINFWQPGGSTEQ